MKNKNTFLFVLNFTVLLFLINISCSEYEEPDLINDPAKTYPESPVISDIDPGDAAVAGVREIVITGQNFVAGDNDANWVFFGSQSAIVKSVSSNQIVVYRPTNYGESLTVKVINPDATSFSKVDGYDIEIPVSQFGDYSLFNYPLNSMEVDNQEYLYIASRRVIYRVPPTGIVDPENPLIRDMPSDFAEMTDLKFGPGGFLYILTGDREIYRMDVNAPADPEQYTRIAKNTEKLDFDEKGNMYTGRRDGIFIVDAAKNSVATGKFSGSNIVEIRVFNNHLYVAKEDTLYRSEILTGGTLGDNQVLVDIKSVPGFNTCDISSFNIASDGTIYLCLQGHPQYSVFVLEGDGSVTPFYYANILPQRVDQLIWGSNRYLYLSRGSLDRDSVRVYRMGMDKNGAPYLGRN